MKTCNVEGCNSPVWSKGACRFHAPKAPLKKVYPNITKQKLHTVVTETFEYMQKRDKFFMGIWIERMHRCEICGKPLGHSPASYMFDHLLEKSKYPELEFEADNIALVCLSCHDKKTRGFVSAEYQEKINFVITKFNVS
jgi:5-methylcytosine-specific restriction endonuclease McrA